MFQTVDVHYRYNRVYRKTIRIAPDNKHGYVIETGLGVIYYANAWWTEAALADLLVKLGKKLDKRLAK